MGRARVVRTCLDTKNMQIFNGYFTYKIAFDVQNGERRGRRRVGDRIQFPRNKHNLHVVGTMDDGAYTSRISNVILSSFTRLDFFFLLLSTSR